MEQVHGLSFPLLNESHALPGQTRSHCSHQISRFAPPHVRPQVKSSTLLFDPQENEAGKGLVLGRRPFMLYLFLAGCRVEDGKE